MKHCLKASHLAVAIALLGMAAHHASASVIIGNIDPAEYPVAGQHTQDETIGQSVLIGAQAFSLSSLQIVQALGTTPGQSFSVYSRRVDGTVGSLLFNSFSLAYDPNSLIETATATAPFTLEANTGYWFLLASNQLGLRVYWDYTLSMDYDSLGGVSLPQTNTSYGFFTGFPADYYDLADGAQFFQLNGTAVPEPSTWAFAGAGLLIAGLARRRLAV